jgi:hypothetical protein
VGLNSTGGISLKNIKNGDLKTILVFDPMRKDIKEIASSLSSQFVGFA